MFKVSFLLAGEDTDSFNCSGAAAADRLIAQLPGLHAACLTRALPGQVSQLNGCLEAFFKEKADALTAAVHDISDLLQKQTRVERCVVGMERVVTRTPDYFGQSRVKGVYPFCRKAGMSVEDFQQHWWQIHGPIAALTENALGYIQIHPVPEYYTKLDHHYDGITEIYWPNEEIAGQALVSRQMVEDQGSDAPNFVDLDSIALFLAEEEIVLAD